MIGRKIAHENAVGKMWPLLGFRLRDTLSGTLTLAAGAPHQAVEQIHSPD